MFKALFVGSLLLNGISGQEAQPSEPGLNGCPATQEWRDNAETPYESPFEQQEPEQCEIWRSVQDMVPQQPFMHGPEREDEDWSGHYRAKKEIWTQNYFSSIRDRCKRYQSLLDSRDEAERPEDNAHEERIKELRAAYKEELAYFIRFTTSPRICYEILEPLTDVHEKELKAAKKCHKREEEDLLNSALGSKRWRRWTVLLRRQRSHIEELVRRHVEEIKIAVLETFFK